MNEQKFIETVNYLLFVASACLFYGITYLITDNEVCHKDKPTRHENETYMALRPEPFYHPFFDYLNNITMPVYETITVIETEYIGEYFVTAYTAEECGWNYGTASGEEVEWHEEWYIPSTAAIDPRYHSFGEHLMIEGKIYRCADTGGAVKGRWVDCYVPDMQSVRSWETGYKSVYSVNFTEKRIKTGEVKIYDNDSDLQFIGFCDRSILRNVS